MLRAVTPQDKELRRTEILDAALVVFADKGYRDATVADVARTAGLSYGSVYVYFDSKDDLFLALMRHVEQTLIDRIDESRDRQANRSGYTAFVEAVAATLEFFEHNEAMARLTFRDAVAFDEKFGRQLEGFHERWVGVLAQEFGAAQERGELRDGDPHAMALASTGLISQFALRRLTTDDGMTPHQAAVYLVDFLLAGLLAR